jgi:hypothetical protein
MQTGSFEQFHDKLSNGTMVGNGEHEIYSKISESVTAIPLGYATVRGTDPEQGVTLPSAVFTFREFAGFTILPNTKEKSLTDATGTVSWALNESVPTAIDGLYAIKCFTSFTAGNQGSVQVIANLGINPGELRDGVDGVNSSLVPVEFQTSGLADEIAVIRFIKQI